MDKLEIKKRSTTASILNSKTERDENDSKAKCPPEFDVLRGNNKSKSVNATLLEESVNKSSLNSLNEDNYLVNGKLNEKHKLNLKTGEKLKTFSDDSSNSEEIIDEDENDDINIENFVVNIQIDLVSILLFIIAFSTRAYRLGFPNNVVFDELHYARYVSLYIKNTFFFDQHPPLGKQIIAVVAHLAGFNGQYNYTKIGSEYSTKVPIFWLRFVPALCGSLLSPTVYKILLELKLNRWAALLGGLLIILDNSLLTQSRLILLESMLILFSCIGILYLLRFQEAVFATPKWYAYGLTSAVFLTFALSVKYVGIYTYFLVIFLMCRYIWTLLLNARVSDFQIICQLIARWILFVLVPVGIYILIFYIHLSILHKAGPHDTAMTSAFQASLDGGLASITAKQPSNIAHGSQITLRHTHGRACWLHSHEAVYPIRYRDKRGSSHQQQVTCYSFKDVNNWWIIKRPNSGDLVVGEVPDVIKHGDVFQIVHGITSRGLNTHDVAAPVTAHSQEVSCYIDYNISMAGQLLWKLDIINRETEGDVWHAIRSEVRLIHVATNTALKFSGRQLPDWGYNQHEVVADKHHDDVDIVWNVEEHRYTKTEDEKERERQMLNAEMIPTTRTHLSFWQKFVELQLKMLYFTDPLTSHMYSSEPYEWPLLEKGIAYWVDKSSNGQIYFLGNIVIWYFGTLALIVYTVLLLFYLIRRRRLCYDLSQKEWNRFINIGAICFTGYLFHYLPYYFVDRTMFLHNYLTAFIYKIFILCYILEHIELLIRKFSFKLIITIYRCCIIVWLAAVVYVYIKFLAVSYGIQKLTFDEIADLRWRDTWDFIMHKDLP